MLKKHCAVTAEQQVFGHKDVGSPFTGTFLLFFFWLFSFVFQIEAAKKGMFIFNIYNVCSYLLHWNLRNHAFLEKVVLCNLCLSFRGNRRKSKE